MTAPFRVLVTGSRDWDDDPLLCITLAMVVQEAPAGARPVIVHGACPRGADNTADIWARNHQLAIERHRADWSRHGRAAGFRRNAEMVALGADVVLAFIKDGSRGASHTADLAEKAGIPVKRYEQEGERMQP
jgi:hypothetical protein